LAHVTVQGKSLIATAEATKADFQRFGGVDEINLAAYDFFVLIGLNLNVMVLDALYRAYRCFGLNNWDDPDDLRSLISRPLAEVFLANRLKASLNFSLAQMIRQTVDTPIFLQAQPRPGKTLLEPGNKYPIFRKMLLRQDTAALSALFEAAAKRLPELYLPQPAKTIEDGLFTAAPYCQGSARLTVDLTKPVLHPANDYMHANASYGALVLQQLGERLRQL
jgi:hypothetical protein